MMVPFGLRTDIGFFVGVLVSTGAFVLTKCPLLPVPAMKVDVMSGGLNVELLKIQLIFDCVVLKNV